MPSSSCYFAHILPTNFSPSINMPPPHSIVECLWLQPGGGQKSLVECLRGSGLVLGRGEIGQILEPAELTQRPDVVHHLRSYQRPINSARLEPGAFCSACAHEPLGRCNQVHRKIVRCHHFAWKIRVQNQLCIVHQGGHSRPI